MCLVVPLLLGWIHSLYSAVCHTGKRAAYLAFLNSEHAVLEELPPATLEASTNSSAFQWAILRQVRCRTLNFNEGDNMEIREQYLRTSRQPVHVRLSKLNDTAAYVCMLIAAHCRTICSLYCEKCDLGSSVSSIFACCAVMQEICLDESSLTAEHFARVLCPYVKTLVLFRCKCDDQCMMAAVRMCPNVVNLDIGDNNLTDQVVRDTVTKLPQLQKLSLYKLPISDATVIDITVSCCALSAIDLASCAALTDVAVIAVVTNYQQLTHILLYTNSNYTRESLRAIALHCPGLMRCVFDRFQGASEQDEVLLFNSCRQLERVEMYLSSPASVASIPLTVTHLTLQAEITTDETLYAVAKYCKNLTNLSIVEGSPATRLYTDEGLAAIAGGCRKLRKLVLQGDAEQVTVLALLVWRHLCPQLEVDDEVDTSAFYVFMPAKYLP